MICRFVFSGTGGQGVVTAAIILAEAAVQYEGLNAVQTQSFGPEARGGAARSDVVVSSEEIMFPKVIKPNVLVCLSQEAYDKHARIVRPGGAIVIDTHYVKKRHAVDARQVELDAYLTIVERLGTSLVFNSCVLGSLVGLIELINIESVEKVMEKRFNEKYRRMNIRALHLGFEKIKALFSEAPISFS